ncbi:MAG: ribonuclease H-like YkuK family protein [Firmicutes bacterium]|nr:ribonuclease H-like YkuK family protein [Dethiobacter sp.]MBS3889173.1 ribonuclease H-like YkuK family protein [Bacillota bacterium]MBS4054728.1 ribonuclease H-like YkuK family protein [Thermaerobacter sp.]
MTLEQMVGDIANYVREDHSADYRLMIGTDSHTKQGTHMVTAIIIQRVGRGARYFYRHSKHLSMRSLRQKLFYETSLSLEVVFALRDKLARSFLAGLRMEIHVDAGYVGPTRELIREVVGMVVANGLVAQVKPYSFAASAVANKYTK